MGDENRTGMTEFYFRPFSSLPKVQLLIFLILLLMYMVSVCGNGTIVLIVCTDCSLHTPMYFFLANLAAMEICYSTIIAPLTLANLTSLRKATISLAGCGIQMFFFIFLGGAGCVLLAFMAYDRYVAICHPLRYTIIMSWTVCVSIVAASLALGFLVSLNMTILIFHLPFCGTNEIYHFFCDIPAILHLLACSNTHAHQVALYICSVINVAIPFLLICFSYAFIVVTILRISSGAGWHRTFSTCSSHLMVVALMYGCSSFIYLRPSSSYSPEQGRVVSVVYTFVTPVLNPLIYSMRNKELKDALSRALGRKVLHQSK
ncbi:LOW QUALITY PROTEIN: olfactory receptor 10V1-like [Trachemys scripta elegans]|uniref:LOW QUALITY PROTEIN: olfactory receptor 10V1-like n=1 Tax=Trachemys scripta elegans TaxID=31138 RepID=UPI0015573CD1|nr:LOW QUALITY PROTEIN: olfactory receptor 10V1-like [Trachemys scripta elegans]